MSKTRWYEKATALLPMLMLAAAGLGACSQVDTKDKEDEHAMAVQAAKDASAQLEKPYLINENKEVIAEIPPQLLSAIQSDLRNQGKQAAADNLAKLYDAKTGKLNDANRLAEIQNRLDKLGHLPSIVKGGAQ